MDIFNMELVRMFTAGHIDDGKSTLIGRLLLDSNVLSTDVICHVTEQGGGTPNLAFLTDGLRAERSMGITIDIAHSFFRTENRQFILVDTPGHEEYTRNMFSGASVCDIALVLLDAQRGMASQTKKHIDILVSIGIRNVVFAINKMDLVGYETSVFDAHCDALRSYLIEVGASFNTWFVPLSALTGEGVVSPANNLSWYEGETLFTLIQTVSIPQEENASVILAVEGVLNQTVYAKVRSGVLSPQVSLRRFQENITIPSFLRLGSNATAAGEGTSVAFEIPPDVTIERGQLWATEELHAVRNVRATLCWMAADEPGPELPLVLSRGTAFHSVVLNIPKGIALNALYEVSLYFDEPIDMALSITAKRKERFILVDPRSNQTVAAGTFLTF